MSIVRELLYSSVGSTQVESKELLHCKNRKRDSFFFIIWENISENATLLYSDLLLLLQGEKLVSL